MNCNIENCDDCIYPDCILTEAEAARKNKREKQKAKQEAKRNKASTGLTPKECSNCAWGTKTMCQGGLAIRCINGKLMEPYERCRTWTEM